MEIQKSNQLRILLVGKTGSGKSSLGNQLKGDKVFKVSRNNGTKESQLARRTLEDGTELVIVDTPGYCNTHLSDEDIQSEVDRGMELLAPGPHFIINVFSSTERVTGDDITRLQNFQRRFDLYLQKHALVVFTGVDELEEEGQTLEEYIQMLPTQLKDFLSKLGWAPIGVAAKHHTDIHNSSKVIHALQQLYNKPGQPFIDIPTVTKRKGDISVEEPKVAKIDGISLNGKRTVVVLGKSGIGKSSLGNVLLGEKKKFSASMLEERGTKTCQVEESDQLVVVDTPGFFSSLRSDVDTATDIITTLEQKSIHVFILVLSVDERFSGSEDKVLDFVRSLFGSEIPEQLVYVFTGKDSLEDDDREFIFPPNLPRRPYYIVNCKGYTQKDRDDLLTEILGRRFHQPIPLTRMDAQLDNITSAEKQRIASTKVDGEAYRTAVYSRLGIDEQATTSVRRDDDTKMTTEFRVAILGKTGAGKSSLGNSLIGQSIFKSSLSASSVSQQCEIGECQTSIGKLKVVDTPGLFDTAKPNGETIKELVKCVGLLAPGPHVFIFVLTVDRFTQDDIETIHILKQILGEGTIGHVIVVFTRKDKIKEDTTPTEFIQSTPEYLKQLLRDVNNRYEFICNRQKNSSHAQDVEKVLSLIKNTVQQNGGNYYIQEMFQAAEEIIQKEIREKQKKEKKSDEDCRQEIQTEIVNDHQTVLSELLEAVIKIFRVTLPDLATTIIVYIRSRR